MDGSMAVTSRMVVLVLFKLMYVMRPVGAQAVEPLVQIIDYPNRAVAEKEMAEVKETRGAVVVRMAGGNTSIVSASDIFAIILEEAKADA